MQGYPVDARHDRLNRGQARASGGQQAGWHSDLGADQQPPRDRLFIGSNLGPSCRRGTASSSIGVERSALKVSQRER